MQALRVSPRGETGGVKRKKRQLIAARNRNQWSMSEVLSSHARRQSIKHRFFLTRHHAQLPFNARDAGNRLSSLVSSRL
jgi:hypothetical protein